MFGWAFRRAQASHRHQTPLGSRPLGHHGLLRLRLLLWQAARTSGLWHHYPPAGRSTSRQHADRQLAMCCRLQQVSRPIRHELNCARSNDAKRYTAGLLYQPRKRRSHGRPFPDLQRARRSLRCCRRVPKWNVPSAPELLARRYPPCGLIPSRTKQAHLCCPPKRHQCLGRR